MVQIPLLKVPSISNIVRGEDTTHLFDGDTNTTYLPTYPSWNSPLSPLVTHLLVDTKFSSCIPRQIKFLQKTGANFGTNLYFITKATKEKILIYTFDGSGGYQPDTYQVYNIPAAQQVEVTGIIFEAPGGGPSYPAEVQIWGDYTEKQIVLKRRATSPVINLLGFVCYPWNTALAMWPSSKDAFTSLKPKRIRVYDDYGNIFENGKVNLHWDQFNQYTTLKGMGVDVKDCIQNHPQYPYALGPQRLDPATYIALGRDAQKYAIANKAAGSPVNQIQIENEIDRSWKSIEEYMDGSAIAALMSMCYDGHKGKYPDAGIKQIDSSVKVINPGCATDRTQILHQMRIWVEENRGFRPNGSRDFPFDCYEFHWYQSDGGQYAGKPGGMPAEIVINRVQEIVDFFREYCPEMEICIGEYGLDSHPDSDLNAPAYGKYTAQQTRGNWFVRDLMMFAKVGINYAEWYRETMDWADDKSDPTGQTNLYDQSGQFFDTMDLIRPNHYAQPAVYTRRIVGDYFRQLAQVFAQGYKFDSVVSTDPYVFKFTKDDATLYALWTLETITWPASAPKTASKESGEAMYNRWKLAMQHKEASAKIAMENSKRVAKGLKPLPMPKSQAAPLKTIARATFTENVRQYTLDVKGQLMRFVDGGDSMSSEAFNGGAITVDAKPVFVVVGGSTPPPPPPPPTKEIYHRGYWTINSKRVYYINYKDGTWTLANGKYVPI
jgi:hypothetical protein